MSQYYTNNDNIFSREINKGFFNDYRARENVFEMIPSKVILISFIHPKTTLQEIYGIAAPFGRFINIVVLKEKGRALIEFENIEESRNMIEYFKLNTIFIRYKSINVQYSKHDHLDNNRSGRDFTEIYNSLQLYNATKVLHSVIDKFLNIQKEMVEKLFGQFGSIRSLIIYDKIQLTHIFVEMSDIQSAIMAKISLDGLSPFDSSTVIQIQFSTYPYLSSNPSIPNNQSQIYNHTREQYNEPRIPFNIHPNQHLNLPITPAIKKSNRDNMRISTSSYDNDEFSVIFVSGLPTNTTCDQLYNLIGSYGVVNKIKIMYKNPDRALVEMQNKIMAERAIYNLNGIYLMGVILKLKFSEHTIIRMPSSDCEHPEYTKDYKNSTFCRFRKMNSKNYKHIYPPSDRLHLSNLPLNITQDDIREIFQQIVSINVNDIKFLPNLQSQCIIKTNSISDATLSIMRLHNYVLRCKNELKVSYAKSKY